MATLITPNLASLIPAADLAAAVRLAFDTLVELLADKKTSIRERRMAAVAVLRLTSPERKLRVNQPSAQPPSPPHATPTRVPSALVACSSRSGLEHVQVEPPTPAPTPSAPTPVTPSPLDHPQPHSRRPAAALLAALGATHRSPIQPRAA